MFNFMKIDKFGKKELIVQYVNNLNELNQCNSYEMKTRLLFFGQKWGTTKYG